MERMKKEKESGTLLGVGTAYLPVKEIKGEFYVKVSDFTRCMDGIRIEQEADRKHIEELEEENKKLKNMINTTIGIAYDKDDFDAIEYLVHERDGSEYFTLKDIKDGKTKREGSSRNKAGKENV